jgi:hypothetical protein
MFRKLIYLVSFVLVLYLVGNVQAANVIWTDAGPDHLWGTPANWDLGTLPSVEDAAKMGMLPGPTIVNEDVVVRQVWVGNGGIGALTVDGGTLATAGHLQLGRTDHGTLYMISGTVTAGDAINVGNKASGTLNMIGGTIIINENLMIPQKNVTGHVNLDGGIIITSNLHMRPTAGSVGTMDVRAGTLIIDGDELSKVQGYIDNGWITAYGVQGTLHLDYDVTNKDKTTLKATHMLNPNPAYGSSVAVTVNQLQWTLTEPNQPGGVVTCDVYFGTDPDIETNPKVVIGQAVESVSVTLVPDTTYYWALDLYDSSISTTEPFMLGSIVTFTVENQPPIVNAGADVVTWLADGVRTGNLDGTVTDDGLVSPYTVQWTVVSEPDVGAAVIETATAEDTSITMKALGEYVLQLEASDGEYTSSDIVTINVYNDSCEAAKALPDYEPTPGDLNGDCIVDDLDLAILQENWLKDNSLTEP